MSVLLLSLSSLRAQEPPPTTDDTLPAVVEQQQTQAPPAGASSRKALESLLTSIALVESDLDEARTALQNAQTEVEKADQAELVKQLTERLNSLRADFESIATGVNLTEFQTQQQKGFELKDELDGLLRPIIEELKDITEQPRVMEQLRSDIGYHEDRLELSNRAVENLELALQATEPGTALANALEEVRQDWEARITQTENRLQVLNYRLEEREKTQRSFFEATRDGFRSFFRSRGRNLMLTLATFFGVFLGLRYLHRRVVRSRPARKPGKRAFYIRVIDVGWYALTSIGALAAALVVLYATGDWVLMGLAIILLIGLILAAKNGFPIFYEQARILLNLGEIREGERVVYNGVPWLVESLHFFSTLRNPALSSGRIRLPLRKMQELISRPVEDGEPWFPSMAGDWVELADGTRGRVVAQTPELVQLVLLGGSKVTYQIPEYLGQAVTNLSANFRVKVTFGIDYQHQAISTTQVPEILWNHLTRELCKMIDHEQLQSLKVEFKAAGPSSLDYEILADFHGEIAAKKEVLTRAIQRMAVDVCNQNGWIIPFTQITLHQAAAVSGAGVEAGKDEHSATNQKAEHTKTADGGHLPG